MTSDGPSQIIEFTELDFIRLVGNLGTRLEGSFEPVRGRGFHALVEACNVIDDPAGISPFGLWPVALGVATLLRWHSMIARGMVMVRRVAPFL